MPFRCYFIHWGAFSLENSEKVGYELIITVVLQYFAPVVLKQWVRFQHWKICWNLKNAVFFSRSHSSMRFFQKIITRKKSATTHRRAAGLNAVVCTEKSLNNKSHFTLANIPSTEVDVVLLPFHPSMLFFLWTTQKKIGIAISITAALQNLHRIHHKPQVCIYTGQNDAGKSALTQDAAKLNRYVDALLFHSTMHFSHWITKKKIDDSEPNCRYVASVHCIDLHWNSRPRSHFTMRKIPQIEVDAVPKHFYQTMQCFHRTIHWRSATHIINQCIVKITSPISQA